ncbi:MAG: glycosyltransferase family 61 protein, partial [Pseudomonadota bacterium]
LNAWRKERRANRKTRALPARLELGSQLAVAEDIAFSRNFSAIGGRWFLNGAGGGRLWTRYLREQRSRFGHAQTEDALTRHFAEARDKAELPSAAQGSLTDLPFVLDARNLFNYYHFMAETFCHLALLDDLPGHTGDILIIGPDTAPKGFVTAFTEALFPDLAPRIRFPGTEQRFSRALTPFTPNFYLFQAPDALTASLRTALPASKHWDWTYPAEPTRRTLKQNSTLRSQALLRARALRAIEGKDFRHLPRRFWFGRRSDGYRDRSIPKEDTIRDALHARGFETLYFEDLTPLEQIAAIHRAEIAVSYHGAGFTNALYAGPDTHVIELGTVQSGTLRWADFLSLSHASGCHYTLGICDGDVPLEGKRPSLRGTLHNVAISDSGIAALLAHIDGLLA